MTIYETLHALTAPCREVDVEIAKAFGLTAFVKSPYKSACCECPHYTASLDATVALVERELPDAECDLSLYKGSASASVYVGGGQSQETMHHHTIPAVALLMALMDAKGFKP